MKNFSKFLEEITIKGNIGIPGETGDSNDPNYLRKKEEEAKRRLGVTGRETPREVGRYNMEIMEILHKSMDMVRGKESELEELAEKVIRSNYESILDNVELDIKLLRPGKVKKFIDEEGESGGQMPSYRIINDPEIKKHVDKAKILNNIIQGEAKNTKNILQLPEVLDELVEIFGERKAKELFGMWVRITELADKMDWIIPIEVKAHMIEEQPEGMAGAVKVDWKVENSEDIADKVLKSLEQGGDIEDNKEDIEEMFSQGKPVIKARGVDFPMLLHETVKGIYELISAASLPSEEDSEEEKRIAKIAKISTSSYEDEAEDFRYGPEIAADLRDFINESPNIDKYPNIRERVYGKMVDRNYMEVDSFLSLMKGILSNTDVARKKINDIVKEVIDELDEYEKSLSKWEMGEVIGHEEEEPEYPGDEEELIIKAPKEEELDYSKWRQADLQKAIDDALDEGDYELVGKLSKYLKEGRSIYLKELQRINEGLNPHTK